MKPIKTPSLIVARIFGSFRSYVNVMFKVQKQVQYLLISIIKKQILPQRNSIVVCLYPICD